MKTIDEYPDLRRKYRSLTGIPQARRWLFERLSDLELLAEHARTQATRDKAAAELRLLKFELRIRRLIGPNGERWGKPGRRTVECRSDRSGEA